jgi:hypothetical protein
MTCEVVSVPHSGRTAYVRLGSRPALAGLALGISREFTAFSKNPGQGPWDHYREVLFPQVIVL